MPFSRFVPLAILISVASIAASGVSPWPIVIALPLIFILCDAVFGKLTAANSPRRVVSRSLMPLWLFAAAQLVFIAACIVASRNLAIGRLIGLGIAAGMTIGIFGMLAAHEMIHSRRTIDRAIGMIALTTVFYAHFRIAHIYGHHRFAGTAGDPAAARRDENAYRFALRSTAQQAVFAYRFERRRHDGRGSRNLAAYIAIVVAMLGADALIAGWRGVACHLLIGAVAIFILETFNYVVHYGLARRMIDGGIEPFGGMHSWNVAHRFSNWALLNGGLHSAHHRAPTRHHARLRHDAASPDLPGGFGLTMCLALVPPLWRRVMNPRVDAVMKA